MGSRSRRRERSGPPAGYARSEERNERLRQKLEPLKPGERPRAVTVAAIVAVLLALANIVAALSGNEVADTRGDPAVFTGLTTAILLLAAAGMWFARYWAVLGFQAILALQIIVCCLALLRVEKVWAALLLVALIVIFAALFWSLVRAMARIQMPERR
jgi:hypothetical protein